MNDYKLHSYFNPFTGYAKGSEGVPLVHSVGRFHRRYNNGKTIMNMILGYSDPPLLQGVAITCSKGKGIKVRVADVQPT